MAANNNDYLAYIKYEGDLVADGYLDAKKSAEALTGIDEVLRYFLYQMNQDLSKIEFDIPVKIQQGSWEALIPHDFGEWLIRILETGVGKYVYTAFNNMAKHDFENKGMKDVAKEAVKAIQWVLKIATHLRSMVIKKFSEVDFKTSEHGEHLIGIKNDFDVIIYVPQKYLEIYTKCPAKLFSRLAKIIEEGRALEIGFNPNAALDKDDIKENIKIAVQEKYLFTDREDENTIIFPELKHGAYVELNGHVTRGNENTNTIGFDYLDHILICTPTNGSIRAYKSLMFINCLIKGYIDRTDDEGNEIEKKPKIRFIDLIDISKSSTQLGLFSR